METFFFVLGQLVLFVGRMIVAALFRRAVAAVVQA